MACTAASACIAVGQGNGATLAEAWNWTSWAIQPTPNPPGPASATFSGVSCPGAAACTGVGSYTNTSGTQVTLAEQWDGTDDPAHTHPAGGRSTAT